ncbi:RidA family protein [Neopusillimonas maritima]|jgi:2-iminobutanoate/2-iminopropanoate deaminase|uniref:Enamine deaminase RidA n=1 Tax=Neopusillimonas maritima TaxID=2026239 RepID=A0ABX9N0M2_9BURK|nr:RidA family protein [Neopusillimonas maritima]RII83237.1 hypothetical protein CJO09_06425 [Neopusillimonas maritima]
MKTTKEGRSIEVPGVTHGSVPIPMGARVGNIIFSSGIMGKDPVSDTLPSDGLKQVYFVFENLRSLLMHGGASLRDVVHVKVFIKDNTLRDAINKEWVRAFPNHHDRPARHTLIYELQGGMLVQLEVVAVITEK